MQKNRPIIDIGTYPHEIIDVRQPYSPDWQVQYCAFEEYEIQCSFSKHTLNADILRIPQHIQTPCHGSLHDILANGYHSGTDWVLF